MKLNANALECGKSLLAGPTRYQIAISRDSRCGCLVDCGIEATGGLQVGCRLAEICLAGLANVTLTAGDANVWRGPWVATKTDFPVAACMASQYAGWQIALDKYFAMGSGPMRAARGQEPIFEKIGFREHPDQVVGVLESTALPSETVCRDIAEHCGVVPGNLTLLVAPTASIAGTIQVVARSVETAMHKLFELGFDLERVISGWGIAPLPPVASDILTGIGRTNDAVLYGARVTLWVRGDDATLQRIGPRVPSCASPDYGRPFAQIFEHYDHDFYKIDPLLFSPAEIHLINIETGNSFRFGRLKRGIL